jgi:hypothetical protein
MDTNTAATHLQRLQIESEVLQIKSAIAGIKKGDLFVFYTDRSLSGQVLFLDNLKHFPLNIESEIISILNESLIQYSELLNELKK